MLQLVESGKTTTAAEVAILFNNEGEGETQVRAEQVVAVVSAKLGSLVGIHTMRERRQGTLLFSKAVDPVELLHQQLSTATERGRARVAERDRRVEEELVAERATLEGRPSVENLKELEEGSQAAQKGLQRRLGRGGRL